MLKRYKTPILLSAFLVLQLGGQIAAGFAGRQAYFLNHFTVISYFCLTARGFIWLLILRRMSLTAAYPFTGMIYVLILPVSAFVFGDSISVVRVVGAVLIFAGVMLTAAGTSKMRRGL